MSETPFATTPDDLIRTQYDTWVYPPRVQDLAVLQLTSPRLSYQDLRSLYWLYWPAGAPREDLDILVAGCGSMQAAAYAYVYPNARVVGLDISQTCLDHNEFLQRKHDLKNLTLRQLPVEQAGSLEANFDFVVCYGLLHQLVDPVAGLRALGQALRQDGVIEIRAHGKYARFGVTLLQELFRVMGVEQNAAGLQTVRDVLATLPPNHPVQPFLRQATQELATDEGLVNTFLSPRDRPFSSAECLELVEQAGLVFQGWKENALYHPDARVPPGDRLWPHLGRLSERQLWHTFDMLDPTIGMHTFHVCRADRDPATYRIHFDGDAFLDYIPATRVSQVVEANRLRRQPAFIARPPYPPMPLDERQEKVFKLIDTARNVRACLAEAGVAPEDPANIAWARPLFGSLWRAGYTIYRLPRA
jgi:SAM-dependent methyltransferase